MSSRCGKKSALAERGEHAYSLDASQKTPPEAVHRADRNTGEVLLKCCDSYLYHDILYNTVLF